MDLKTAEEIRQRFESGGIRKCDLAREYGVTSSVIFKIIDFQIWKPKSMSFETNPIFEADLAGHRLEKGFCHDSKVWGQVLYGH